MLFYKLKMKPMLSHVHHQNLQTRREEPQVQERRCQIKLMLPVGLFFVNICKSSFKLSWTKGPCELLPSLGVHLHLSSLLFLTFFQNWNNWANLNQNSVWIFLTVFCTELMWWFFILWKTWLPYIKIEYRGQTQVFHVNIQNR